MDHDFKELGLRPELVTALQKEGITVPMPVQARVIPEALTNKDLVVESETGTGKTLAYLLPIFEKVNASVKEMQAIILSPTHELAMQIQRQIERLSQNSLITISSAPIIGNANVNRQIEKLREKPQIIVGTSGRILELIKKKKITAHTVKTIVLDEADRLLDDNNIADIKAIIKTTLKERQLLMFSATISAQTEVRAKEMMAAPLVIRGEAASIPILIEHLYLMTEQRDKIEVLRKLVHSIKPKKALVFVGDKEVLETYTAKLKFHGLNAEGIHGSNRKLDRQRTMEAFRGGKFQLLVASDIAARGLDIEAVTHVFNMNIPEDPKDYLHRVGRTGRKGKKGVAISIVTPRELQSMRALEKALHITFSLRDMYKGRLYQPETE